MDVIEEETTEDFEKMAAILPSDKPYLKTGVFETWRSRIPWLMLLMLSATFTGIIITKFERRPGCPAWVLTSFIPMLSGTGGNSGSQSSVAVIRALSLDEIDFSDLIAVVWKESRVAILCGVCLACANFVKMMIVDRWLMNNPAVTPVVALVVCLTLVFTVLCAKVVGCTLPMAAEKIGIDPAVMASPFITTIVDALSLLIYFFFATHLQSSAASDSLGVPPPRRRRGRGPPCGATHLLASATAYRRLTDKFLRCGGRGKPLPYAILQ